MTFALHCRPLQIRYWSPGTKHTHIPEGTSSSFLYFSCRLCLISLLPAPACWLRCMFGEGYVEPSKSPAFFGAPPEFAETQNQWLERYAFTQEEGRLTVWIRLFESFLGLVIHSLLIIYFCFGDRIPSAPSVLVKDTMYFHHQHNIGNI